MINKTLKMEEKGFKRKLIAILSADAVGYSRLMNDDEEATVRTLQSYRKVFFFAHPATQRKDNRFSRR